MIYNVSEVMSQGSVIIHVDTTATRHGKTTVTITQITSTETTLCASVMARYSTSAAVAHIWSVR